MTTKPTTSPARILMRIGVIVGTPILLLAGCLALDQIPMSAARPPKNMKTLAEFTAWKKAAITGMGTYENAGVTYTVMLAPAGRYQASGPSAYLFDANGQFVDWTADMGDFRTMKHRFDLTRGQVKDIEREKP